MGEWQTIESAPKDGSEIVIWNTKYEHCPIAKWDRQDGENDDGEDIYFYGWRLRGGSPVCSCDDEFIGWNEDIEDGFMPTHWQPLPDPPRVEAKGG